MGVDAVERSRKTSLNSLIWDDFLPPYKDDQDKDDAASFVTVESLSQDSKEASPFSHGEIEGELKDTIALSK